VKKLLDSFLNPVGNVILFGGNMAVNLNYLLRNNLVPGVTGGAEVNRYPPFCGRQIIPLAPLDNMLYNFRIGSSR